MAITPAMLALLKSAVADPGLGAAGTYRGCSWKNKLHTFKTATPSLLDVAGRIPYQIGSSPITNIKLWWANFYNDDSGGTGENNTGNAITIDECALEYPNKVSGPGYAQVFFNGSASVVMADGATPASQSTLLTDAVNTQTAFGVASIPVGDPVWLRFRCHVTAGGMFLPVARKFDTEAAGTFQQQYEGPNSGNGTTISPILGTGTMGYVSGNAFPTSLFGLTGNKLFAPIMVGSVTSDNFSCLSIGDSIGEGSAATGGAGVNSFIRRGMVDGSAKPYALIECCSAGSGSAQWLGANTKWTDLLQYTRIVIDEHFANEAITTDQTLDRIQELLRYVKAQGKYTIKLAPMCRASSTDGWVTLVNQTADAPTLQYASNWIDWSRNRQGIDYWASFCASMRGNETEETYPDYVKYAVAGGALTQDSVGNGTHPNELGHATAGTALAPELQAIAAKFGS
jgi:hypothetical protein